MVEDKFPPMTLQDLEQGLARRDRLIEANKMLVSAGLDPDPVPTERPACQWPRRQSADSAEAFVDDLFSDFADEGRGPWFVVHTEPQMERKVHHRLNCERIGCYMPVARKTVRLRGSRTKMVYPPLLRAYVFIRFQWSPERYDDVRNTDGVLDFLRLGGNHDVEREPAVVASQLVAAIAKREFELNQPCGKQAKQHSFRPGDKVKAAEGSLWEDFQGQVKQLLNGDRIAVDIVLERGRIKTVQFPASMIEAV